MVGAFSSLKHLLLVASLSTVTLQKPVGKVDYVIVGGGPAGFVVAEQLSRNPRVKVTLLEAGGDYVNEENVNVPAYVLRNTDKAWEYYSQPDPNIGNRAPDLTQGRGFGGGTAINAMGYCRGSASVFDEWAKISGNSGLAWKSFLNDFRATSHYKLQPASYQQDVSPKVFGDGPLEVSRASELTGLEIPFLNALKAEFGLKEVSTMDGTGIGVDLSLQSVYVNNRTRSYARNAFGFLMEQRPNVQMLSNSWVQRILFRGKQATGVTYINTVSNQVTTLSAKEVIVAGGAINSPKLLMQSGVGPRKTLTGLKIPVVADIPEIGQNLWDHHYSFIEVEATDDIKTYWQWTTNATGAALAQEQYARDASGPLGNVNGEAYGAARVPDSVFSKVNGKHFTSLPADRPHVIYEYWGVPLIQPAPNTSIFTAWVALVQPEASGFLTINSSDYRDAPLMHSNYYGSPADRAAMLYAYKQLRKVLGSRFIRPYRRREVFPGAEATTDDQIWAAIQETASSFHHPVGTVALGTVLGKNWRIKGLKGVRVVDSSAIPKLPTCHPQADVYALAHRAAKDIIRDDGIGY